MTLSELIERNSRKPLAELLTEGAHLSFNEDRYMKDYCETRCPHANADYRWECPGGCKYSAEGLNDAQRKVYGADMLIGEILRKGYSSICVKGINEPIEHNDGEYVLMTWSDAYERDKGICAGCKYYGKPECPEDILSAECVRNGEACAIERVTEAVNDELAGEVA